MNATSNWVRVAYLAIAVLLAAAPVAHAAETKFPTEPQLNDGKRWRVAYYEGGPYIEYQNGLRAIVKGLMNLGWMPNARLPEQSGEETASLWKWLTNQRRSDYLEFVSDGHYSAAWEDSERPKVVSEVKKRLTERGDIDLVIAMGTWAGKDLAADDHDVPTIIVFASDPIAAGIIKSVEDSGRAHVHAVVDPTRYERQLKVFHEMVKFEKLGVAYEDSVDGRSYAAMESVNKAAQELGFQVVHCHTVSDIGDFELRKESVKKCFQELAEQVDAIYVTQQGGIAPDSIPELVEIVNEYHIPTFSQMGSDEVRYGFLASLSQSSMSYVGDFNAKTIAQVFNGAQPHQLVQLFEPPPKIAINLKTAEIIDFDPPIMLLGAVDEFFDDIEQPEGN